MPTPLDRRAVAARPGAIAGFLAVVAAVLPGPAASAQELEFTSAGEAIFDDFGQAIAWVGDVDGDSISDFVAGAPSSSVNAWHGGAAYLVSGADGGLLHTWRGTSLDDQLGAAVCAAGDVNGDGIGDVLVGAPNVAGCTVSGSVQLYSGADGTLVRSFSGATPGDTFGAAIAVLSDQNGDGVGEVAIGAPGAASFDVFDGATGLQLIHFISSQPGCNLGEALAGTDDVDGDGIADFLVSSPFWLDASNNVVGRLQVRSGSDGSVLRNHYGENSSMFAVDLYGWSTTSLADVDADGVRDYLTGAWAFGAGQKGRIYLYSGKTGSELWRADGAEDGDLAGLLLADAGDLDRDGVGDLLVSHPTHGSDNNGQLQVLSGADGSEITHIDGAIRERLSAGLAAMGDADGDGEGDLLVASIGTANGYAGTVVRYECRAPTLLTMSPDRGDARDETVVLCNGGSFRAEAGLVVTLDGEPARDLVLLDAGNLRLSVPVGEAGLATLAVETRFGRAEAIFKRTPAITVVGDLVPGGGGVWSTFIERNDTLMLIAGVPPALSIATPPYRGRLAIAPYFVVWVEPSFAGDRFDLAFDIEADPALSGVTLLAQALVGSRLGGRRKDGSWTNWVEVAIQ